jgi:serine protease Do
MKPNSKHLLIVACTALLAASAVLIAEMARPKVSGAEFEKKLTRDSTPVDNGTRKASGYSEVVRRILPSVVSISTYSKNPKRGFSFEFSPEDSDHLPPLFRDFFGDWLERRGNESPRGRQRILPKKPVQTGLGSGVILTSDGYILTNNHVVDAAEELKVEIAGKGRDYTAKVIGTDPQTDVALIKIEATGLTPATIGDSSKLRVGDIVLAVGSPMGLEQSVTHGIVSGLGRSEIGIIGNAQLGQPGYENFIQTDAAINPGNSGGPLLDELGRVVGLNTAIETRSGMFSGIGLAIPINMSISVVHDLLDTGKVQRGFLGIEMDRLDPSMADYMGLEHEGGIIVNSIVENSPASKAGFQEGDVIVSVNDQKVSNPAHLRLVVSSHRPDTEVKFGVVRYNEKTKHADRIELVARLRPLPDKLGSKMEKKPSGDSSGKPDGSFLKGVSIRNLNDELRKEYNIADDVEGVVVADLDKDSAAAGVLEEGDVIIQVNHKPVKNVTEAMSSKADAGSPVQLKILRNGRTKFVIVKS